MATAVIILANKNSIRFIETLAEKAWSKFKEENTKIKDPKLYMHSFCEFDEYAKAEFSQLIKIDDKKHVAAIDILLLITPELFWRSDEVDEGYKYALEIITKRLNKENHILQFRFLSVLPFTDILKKSSAEVKGLVEAFPYYSMIEEQERILRELYDGYTQIHYQLIKKIIVSKAGYINYLLHELNVLITDRTPTESKDRELMMSISGLDHLTGNDSFSQLVRNYTFQKRKKVFEQYKLALHQLMATIENTTEINQKVKIPYKALIVDDSSGSRNTLKNLLENYFTSVHLLEPSENENYTEAINRKLPNDARNYDIIFLDLLFKNENGNWAAENGIDLYKKIKAKNPFCVTPIVTSLTRSVAASLIKEVDTAGIPYHLLFTKVNGEEFLKLDFQDKLPDIIKTIEENKNKEGLAGRIMIPKQPPFKDVRVELYKRINGQFDNYEHGIVYSKEFEERIEMALSFYKQHIEHKCGKINNPLSENNEWSKELKLEKDKLNIDLIWARLTTILTYRLIVLHYSTISSNGEILTNETIFSGATSRSLNKKFLSQMLAFNINELKENSHIGNRKEAQVIGYKLQKGQVLFPHEWDFVLDLKESSSKEQLNTAVDDDVKTWFRGLLEKLPVYENISVIGFDDKCIYEGESGEGVPVVRETFLNEIKYDWIEQFFSKILRGFNHQLVMNMTATITEYDECTTTSLRDKLPNLILEKIDAINRTDTDPE